MFNFKLSKIALAVICLQGSVTYSVAPHNELSVASITQESEQLIGGWGWSFSKANAGWDDSQSAGTADDLEDHYWNDTQDDRDMIEDCLDEAEREGTDPAVCRP